MKYLFVILNLRLPTIKWAIFGVILPLLPGFPALAQKEIPAFRFGKLPASNFIPKVCPIDSAAHAYYLFDHGQSTFLITPEVFKVVFERHFRIRIQDKSAFDQADISIPLYYKDPKSEEKLVELKGITYNLENGELVETKLEKSSIFKEKTGEHQNQVKFTMPNIREGSIIEVLYKIESDFLFNFQGWVFQHDIPVLESEYLTAIPEQLQYNPYFWGYLKVNVSREERKKPGYDFFEILNGYLIRNVPAFPSEPYIHNKENYRTRVEFELASTKFGIDYKEYTKSWAALNKLLLEDQQFGLQLSKTGYFKDEVAEIQANFSQPNDKINAAHQLIQQRMRWNGDHGIYTTGNIRKSFEQRKGNVADINLCLVSMLRELGLSAFPVVLSTIDNGAILPTLPTLTKMNYVLAAVIQGDKKILLDAADPFATPSLLPGKCLNGQGRLINDQDGVWVDLKTSKIDQSQAYYKLDLDPQDGFKGTYQERHFNYSAYRMRHQLGDSTDLTEYLKNIHEKHPGTELTEAIMTNFNDYQKDIILDAKIKTRGNMEVTDELIYFTPIQMEKLVDNPLKIEDRQFPVEFEYPWLVNATVEIRIPESYDLESTPKSAIFQNASKTAKFTFGVEVVSGNTLKISSLIFLTKAQYEVDEYEGLRDFFNLVVSKHAEQVVLKKKV
ncbi:MAG TPA: DUF3857 domain-containing protein [Saprospiraceae bacterium]|nr:DUF3857 domain-containing protein [Saprospiraceae bacterium]HNT20774.1 DUF3857 domain-containing protein [Saprospiraceae bacterium]